MPRLHNRIAANYSNPSHPTAFAGRSNLQKYYRIPEKRVENFLNQNYAYQLHREYKPPKIRNPFFIYSLREQIQFDLIDISNLKRWNNGITFLLVGVECFSRKAWVVCMKNKTAETTLEALKSIIDPLSKNPKHVLFDEGREFKNRLVTTYLHSLNINIIHPHSDVKAAIAERFNKTFQRLIYQYLTDHRTRKYVDALPSLLRTYNDRGHRTLDYLTPNEAEQEENQNAVLNSLNKHYSKAVESQRKIKIKYQVGDVVRLRIAEGHFQRHYEEQFTKEYFVITEIRKRMPVQQYFVKSMDLDDEIKGAFYKNELQLCVDDDIFQVERVLKRRVRNGRREVLVKWLHFGARHNSWIPA